MSEESKTALPAGQPGGAADGGRNYGIDLLRLLAVFYIVVNHATGRGGLLGRHLYLSWFLYVWGFCGVNCFALISGYVGYRPTEDWRPKLGRYLSLWLEVVFYGLVMAAIYKLILPGEVTAERFIKALLPVSSSEYWYFTAYTGVFFAAPLINLALKAMSERAVKASMLVFFLLFSVLATLAGTQKDIFLLNEGYSFCWLAILYYMGAGMKKTGLLSGLKPWFSWPMILVLVGVSELWLIGASHLELTHPVLLIQHLSPTIVVISLLHVVVFSVVCIGEKGKKFLRFAAPGAFAVYLLNANPCFWDYTLHDVFVFLSDRPIIWMPVTVVAFALLFVLAALAVDYLRRRLFAALGIEKFSKRLGDRLDSLLLGRGAGG